MSMGKQHIIEKQKIKHIPTKRIFDFCFSLFIIILFAPLFLTIALFIRCTSKGRAIYSHERIGRGGRPFKCYKFRTMYQDADAQIHEIFKKDPLLEQEWKEKRKLKQDPRVTPFGSFLRKTSLDELPQFWNVVKGDLSIVGPRPVISEEVESCMGSKAEKILSIRPGLTCLWQVSGRSDSSYSHRLALDEAYVDGRSFLLDLKLIIKTIPQMIFPKGAY